MNIYAIKIWDCNYRGFVVTYKLERWNGVIKWVVDENIDPHRYYLNLGSSPAPHEWILDFEESHLYSDTIKYF